jgi:hypothetical protein
MTIRGGGSRFVPWLLCRGKEWVRRFGASLPADDMGEARVGTKERLSDRTKKLMKDKCAPACRNSLTRKAPYKAQTFLLDRMVTGRLSSVDVENFSSHESRRVQVHYRVHDVRHFSHSAHRM